MSDADASEAPREEEDIQPREALPPLARKAEPSLSAHGVVEPERARTEPFRIALTRHLETLWRSGARTPGERQAVPEELIRLLSQLVIPASVVDETALTELAGGGENAPPLEGNPDEIQFAIAAAMEQLVGRTNDIDGYVRGTLASTVAALENEGAATPESIVDMVAVALAARPLDGTAVPFLRALWDYLSAQEERTAGFDATTAQLATLAVRIRPTTSAATGFALALFHKALEGISSRITSFQSDLIQNTIITSANNAGSRLGDILQRRGRDVTEHDRSVLRALLAVAVAWLDSDVEVYADDIAADLGISDFNGTARDLVLGLAQTATVPAAWPPSGELAFVQAAGAVASAIIVPPRPVAVKFFNAGVTLLHLQRPPSPEVYRARLCVNVAGLCWSLLTSGDVASALGGEGLDCVVNLAGAISDRRDAGQALEDFEIEILRVARAVASWPALSSVAGASAKAGRLLISTDRLPSNLDLIDDVENALPPVAFGLLARLSGENGTEVRGGESPKVIYLRQASSAIRSSFTGVADGSSSSIVEWIAAMRGRREDALFRYLSVAEGGGYLVDLGIVQPSQLRELDEPARPPSLVGLLRNFPGPYF